jgi:hypothetical protein
MPANPVRGIFFSAPSLSTPPSTLAFSFWEKKNLLKRLLSASHFFASFAPPSKLSSKVRVRSPSSGGDGELQIRVAAGGRKDRLDPAV